MGTDAVLVAVGDPALTGPALVAAVDRVAGLEARWSRFLPDSDVSRLRRADGRPVEVTPETAALVAAAVDAWRMTEGRFDPTVLPALERLGYDRSFERIADGADGDAPLHDGGPEPAPGCDGVVVDRATARVTVPRGVALDLGGIGKGRAADLVAHQLLDDGAEGALVDLGGDVRVLGAPADSPAPGRSGRGDRWAIEVEGSGELEPDGAPILLTLAEGAVVTSSCTRRRWRRDGVEQHHLIDPATGLPARSGLRSVTVLAADAMWAEVLAKAAFVAGPAEGAALLARSGAAGILVTEDGRVHRAGPMEEFER